MSHGDLVARVELAMLAASAAGGVISAATTSSFIPIS
jgi:hypothetical protein